MIWAISFALAFALLVVVVELFGKENDGTEL